MALPTTTLADRPAAPSHRAAPRRPPTRHVPLLARLLGWAGAAAVVALWWADTSSVVGLAGWLTGAGRITGLLAGYGCAVLLLLMARLPLLDRTAGTDRTARWHAAAGRYTVGLILVHVLTIVWGYALTGRTGVVDQATTIVLHYPEMLKATAGFLLLLLTGVLSARLARRRLRYETWHLLHCATYLALFLSFGHQLSNGADFVGNHLAQAAWYTLYLGSAALLLWYRVLTPLRAARRHRLRVAEIRQEAPGVVTVELTGRDLARLKARPGQFLRWRFLTPGLWWAANPYSLSAPVTGDRLRITVKAAGRHSAAVAGLRPGTRVWAEGPYGGLTAERARTGRALLLAGGVGITPLRTLFETLPGDVTLLYWAHSTADLVFRKELDAVAARRGARVVYCVTEPAGHSLPLTAAALTACVPDLARRDVYLCGPPGMARAAQAALREAGVPRGRVHHESFAF
ncbi:ferric reductase-like transmembrane domain-containing protein [Streptomyces sp. NPDC059740]|uniref:ferredoxin reductase family protein n=1 Tax=Streptomyces sp. NPDC059740 TaxID=3346926 RepID=UPI00365D012A